MTGKKRILRNVAIGLAAFVVAAGVTGILIVQTAWFQNYLKNTIIESTQEGTGGTAEIGSFQFDWKHLRAVATDFVIHGSEPRGVPPLLRAARVQVDVRLFSSLHHLLDIAYLGIQSPQANIIVFPDGHTNVPSPRQPSSGTALETMIDFAVGHFDLTNGLLVFESQKQVLNVRGSNLRAQLWFNGLKQSYTGDLSFEPMYVASGRNTPVLFTVKLPMALGRDRIDFHDAAITTPNTSLLINGSVENMRDPKISAHLNGRLALADLKNVVNLPFAMEANKVDANQVPAALDVDANAALSANTIHVTGLRLGLGQSNLEASGTLKDPRGNGSLEFKSRLDLGELGRFAKVAARPEGTVLLNGAAKLDANNNYDVGGNIQAKNVSFQQGAQRIQNVNLISAVHFDPHSLDLNGLRLSALGGEFAGNVALRDFARVELRGNLRNLNLRAAAARLGEKQFAYDGTLSGAVEAKGDLESKPMARSFAARAKLTIAPGNQGVPLSGSVNAAYNGSSDDLRVENSYIALPHTRIDFDGSLGNQLNISVKTSDLNDLLAATSWNGKASVNLNRRPAIFAGTVAGKLQSPQLAGHLTASGFSVEGRQFDLLSADVAVSSVGASVRNGALTRGPMQTQFSGEVGLKNWSPTPDQPLSAGATVRNGDVADMLVLAGQDGADYSGALAAELHFGGTVGNPTGAANIQVAKGTILGEPFDRLQCQANLADQSVTVSSAFVEAGAARVSFTADFEHPRDSFTNGRLHAHAQSTGIDLALVHNLQKQRPNTAGALQLNADVSGTLSEVRKASGGAQTEFMMTAVSGDVSVRGLRFEGENYGDISATARSSGQTVTYDLTSNFAGSNIHIAGNTQLVREYPTTADATIRNLPVERLLVAAQRKDIPAKGNLSGTAHFSATTGGNPAGNVDVDLANAVLYDEPLDHVHAQAAYLANAIEVHQLNIVSGPARLEASGRFEHPPGKLEAGKVQFRIQGNNIDLARIQNLQTRRKGMGGAFQITANGTAEIRDTDPRMVFEDLSANVAATGISAEGKNYGDVKLTASTAGGQVNFVLTSNLAGSSIQGHGSAQAADPYAVDAQLTFSNLAWNRLRGLVSADNADAPRFDVVTDGQAKIQGPLRKVAEINGAVELSKLQFASIPAVRGAKPVTLQNQGPVSVSLDHQRVRIDNAHLTGPGTDVQAKGTLSLSDQSMDLTVTANADLALLRDFDRDITSSGTVALNTTVRGTFDQPLVNGRLEVHNGTMNYSGLPNGLSEANGLIVFNGTSASVRNMTAQSGGGKVDLSGFASFDGDVSRFSLRANASGVRVRLEQGASIVMDANLNLSGTPDASHVSGTATITQISYSPKTDIASILVRAAPPLQTNNTPSFLDNMKLDIRVKTSDAMAVRSSLAESLQAGADLRIRGSVSQPGVLGRVTITEGTMTFFNSTYTVNSGTIGFYNPLRIEPVLDVSLETLAQGVDVTVRVTGPVDNLKLTYTSDPPLQFQEIIALLASGKTPSSDPTILANQPTQPSQTFQQMGESALLGSALADPISNRLQRVFGVSQLKIDPSFTSGSELPQAQMTLQQRIASNLTFTYVTALDNPNATIIQMQMTLTPQWSAVATRDQNGIFSVNLLYKRQIR